MTAAPDAPRTCATCRHWDADTLWNPGGDEWDEARACLNPEIKASSQDHIYGPSRTRPIGTLPTFGCLQWEPKP